MEFRLLGPLEVLRDGRPLALGGAKQRALLALLLLRANEVVSRDLLLEELWSDRPPGTAAHSLDVQISRLRKTLGPAELLVTRAGGYALEVDAEQIDARRFERLLEEGRAANAAGKPAQASEVLGQALSLWRGGALVDFGFESFAQLAIARLEELRVATIEERVDAELALGRHQAAIPELESLAARHPLRERPVGQLMLALYRSGRQAEALRLYAATRRRLVAELGLEPGPDLRELEQAILRQDASLGPPPIETRTRRSRRRVAAAVALPAAAAAAAAGVLLTHGGTGSSRAQALAQADSVALVSERTRKVISEAATPAPVFSRFGAGALWNVSFTGVLSKLDPATGATFRSVNAVPIPCGLAVADDSVWVTDCTSPTIVRIDPTQVVVVNHYPIPVPADQPSDAGATGSVAVGAHSLWVAQGTTNPSYVYRLDPGTGRVQARIEIPRGGAGALAFADGALWVGGGVLGHLSRIDARTNVVSAPTPDLRPWLCCVAAGGGYVWAAVGNQVWKFSRRGQPLSSSPRLAADVESLRYADGAVWAADGEAGTVLRIDPASDVTTKYSIGHHVSDVDARAGVLAVSVQSTGRDVTRGLKGRVVMVALSSDTLDANSTDPVGVQSFNTDQLQFHYATCAKLYNYPDRPGAAGKRIEPEVATGWPKVTDGGRTYAFTIRPGFGFSPPSHEHVTAESFRHELERFLKQPGPWSLETLFDVVGAQAYASGRTPHVTGISARGDTLVIRLVRRTGDLPTRLAAPAFCAVPAKLATVPYGLPYPIPTAGPYYLAARSRDAFVLEPNPNYHGGRPQKLDAIVYRTGVDVGTAIAEIGQGKVDYVQSADAALVPGTAASRAAGYRLTANNSTERLALNTRRPLFADVRARRAVASALDRRALARALDPGGFRLPTSVLLPPNVPSSRGPAYPLTSGLETARTLMGGRHVQAVYAAGADGQGRLFDPGEVKALRSQLAAIGVTVTVLPLLQTYTPAKQAAVLALADIADAPANAGQARDPVGYLLHLPYLRPADRAQLARIASLQSPARETAAAALAAKLERDAVYLAVANDATPELVSKRLGCVIDQPEYPGVDLAALCLVTP